MVDRSSMDYGLNNHKVYSHIRISKKFTLHFPQHSESPLKITLFVLLQTKQKHIL